MTVTFRIGGLVIENGDTISTANLPVSSTLVSGIVQLSNSTGSTSTSLAATANAVKTAYDTGAAAQVDATQALANAAAAQAAAGNALPLTGGTMTGAITFAGGQTFPIAGIQAASTSQPGVVQLNDTVSSTSTTQALTANQGKQLQDQINALAVSSNITLAGTIDASTGNLVTVTTEGTAKGFAVGSPLPAAAAGNDNYFVIVTVPGTMTPPGGVSQVCHQGDWWLSDGTVWVFLDVGFNATYATTTTPGVVQLATDAEVQAGSNTTNAVVPSSLQSKLSDSTSTTSSTTIASSTAVKAAYDLANNALPKAGGTVTGDITLSGAGVGVVFNDASTVEAISDSTSTTSSVTAASSTAVKAAYDLANGAVPNTSFLALGDLLSGTGAGTYGNLTLGTDGYVLTADSACSGGIKWAAGGGGGGSAATPTALGTVYGCSDSVNFNTYLGYSAGALITTICNVAIGYCAAASTVSDSYDGVYVGSFSGYQGALSSRNTYVGARTGCDPLNTGTGNTLVGFGAGCALQAGCRNVMIGCRAGALDINGSYNVAIGPYTTSIDGTSNVLIGTCVCGPSGLNNIFIGTLAASLSCGCAIDGNVAIGCGVELENNSGCNQLAIGFSSSDYWLTGTCDRAIKPGGGIIDCANTCGTAGQVLQSTGANSVVWATPAAGYSGYSGYIATTASTKFNVTGYLGELGTNFAGQLNIFTTYDNGSTGGQPIIPGSNALIYINGYNGVGTSTVQAFNTSTGTFAVESVLYPAYTDITVTFTPTVTSDRMNFYIRYLDATGTGSPGNGSFFTPYLTIF